MPCKQRHAIQIKRGYNERRGGGRCESGERLGSFGNMRLVCDRSAHRPSTANGKKKTGSAWNRATSSLQILAECTTTNASKKAIASTATSLKKPPTTSGRNSAKKQIRRQ